VTVVPVILNPIAGGGRLLRGQDDLKAVATANGCELDIWISESPDHTTKLAKKAAAAELPLVLAYGGDGTYNAVAQGLLGTATAMGVLPGGTTSVLAYEFDVPRPARRAVDALLQGEDRAMRVGRTDAGNIVLLMLSAGPDSHVLERLRPSLKRLGGRVGVALQAVLEALTDGPLPKMRVIFNGTVENAGWVIVGKSRCYAGKFCATPRADPFRDDLEFVAQRSTGRRAAVAFLSGIPWGRHTERGDVVGDIVSRIRLEPESPEDHVPYQIDGDVIGSLPVEITIDSHSLWIRLPAVI
jgi:diacylglycerol kinase family enzyme